MMLIKCVLVLLFVNFVCSSVLLRGENEKVKRVLRGAYKYNHPPSAEDSSVPVSVVYEEKKSEEKLIKRDVSEEDESDEVSQESVEDASDEESSEEVSKEVSKEDNKEEMETNEKSDAINPIALKFVQKVTGSSKEELIKDTAKEPDTIESHLKQVAKMFVPQKEMFIPVKVIYDVEPENLRKPDPSTQKPEAKENPKPITRLQRNNHIEKESEVKEVKTKSTPFEKESEVKEVKSKSKPKKTPSEVNIKTGTFPKRTEEQDPVVPIVQSENYVFSHSGDFHYSYEGGDGTKAFERGELSSDKGGESVEGSFSYIGKDGKDYSLTYTADENGYRPVGAHLPTPPPIPVAIARALKYLATKPTPETVTEQA